MPNINTLLATIPDSKAKTLLHNAINEHGANELDVEVFVKQYPGSEIQKWHGISFQSLLCLCCALWPLVITNQPVYHWFAELYKPRSFKKTSPNSND